MPRRNDMKLNIQNDHSIVAVFGLEGWHQHLGKKVTISGLYEVVEFIPREPEAYSYNDSFLVGPAWAADDGWEDHAVVVDAMDLWAQVDPKAYGEYERSEEEAWAASG